MTETKRRILAGAIVGAAIVVVALAFVFAANAQAGSAPSLHKPTGTPPGGNQTGNDSSPGGPGGHGGSGGHDKNCSYTASDPDHGHGGWKHGDCDTHDHDSAGKDGHPNDPARDAGDHDAHG